MASLFPQQREPEERPLSPPDDLLERARQAAQQELVSVQRKPQQANKATLLTGQRRFTVADYQR